MIFTYGIIVISIDASLQHGADLLPLLSRLLNDGTDEKDTTVATLAIEGIKLLCKEAVIDIKVSRIYY